MKLVDQIMGEPSSKKNNKSKVILSISKSFTVPYSGSYEEGELFKIENENPLNDIHKLSDSDIDEFDNFVPPVADDIDSKEKHQKSIDKYDSDKQEDEIIIPIKDIPDVDIPKVDTKFLNDDENKNENENSESDQETINDLLNEVKAIYTVLDSEEESD